MPWTVTVSAELPAAAEVCERELTVGGRSALVGVDSVKGRVFDAPTEFETATVAAPGNAASAGLMAAVSWVALTKVVARSDPFQFTNVSLVKFVPVTLRVNPLVLQ